MNELYTMAENLGIQHIINNLSNSERIELSEKINNLAFTIHPFGKYECIISYLLLNNKMSAYEYETMKTQYFKRNKYLDKFEMAGKSLGIWAENQMIDGNHNLYKPSKDIDPNYSRQTSYDAYMPYNNTIIRVEIKASRVTEQGNTKDSFVDKALFIDTNKPFWMNFQQLKPQYCDVFIFIAVFRDGLKHWILSSNDVKNYGGLEGESGRFSPGQHSGNSGNEGQLHIKETNIHDFDKYLFDPNNIQSAIIEAYKRQYKI